MKIGELAQRSGFSAHTLRYYEKIGLLPRTGRKSGQRDYGADALVWLAFISRLKATDMPLAEMIAYARLRARGVATIGERRELLLAHRKRVKLRVALLQESFSVLDKKIGGYAAEQKRLIKNADAK
ncbi:MAG: MerR family transcriptional regulator [Pseudomonadota bacterium]|nr:MerR family transcriptional regulator [Pseudomonadota bacterium]